MGYQTQTKVRCGSSNVETDSAKIPVGMAFYP
jgi:hypothetical protein